MLCESSSTYEGQNNRKQESYIHRDDRFVVFIPFAKIMKNEKYPNCFAVFIDIYSYMKGLK